MKYDVRLTLAVVILAGQVATTHAQQLPPAHAEGSQADLGHRLPTDAWAQQIDFDTASRMASVVDEPPMSDVRYSQPPAPGVVAHPAGRVALPYVSPPAVGRRGEVENDEAGLAHARQVPEPSAWLMMLAGLGAIGVVMARRGSSREA